MTQITRFDAAVPPPFVPTAALPPLALCYVRVSTQEQAADGVSLAAQTAVTRRYAAERGFQIGGEYQDVLSGRRDDRPQYQVMLAEASRLSAEGRRVVIVVAWLHRLGRRLLEQVRAREALEAMGAAVHAANDGGEVAPFVANILASVAEQQARDVSVQVAGVARETRERGWLTNVPAVWGYRRRVSTPQERAQGALQTTLEVNEAEAPHVVRSFELAAQGETIHAIARWIATLPPEARGGRALTYSIVRGVLHSPLYIARQPAPTPARPRVPGSGAQRATRRRPEARLTPAEALAQPVGKWPPLLSDDLWAAAQAQIDQHRRLPKQARGTYLATGLLRCAACGARMVGATLRNRERRRDGSEATYETRRYTCSSSQHAGSAAAKPCRASVHADSLERDLVRQVGDLLTALTSDPAARRVTERRYERLRHPQALATAAARAAAQRRRAQIEAAQEEHRAVILGAGRKLALDQLDKAAYDDLVADAQTALARLGEEWAAVTAATETPDATPLPSYGEALALVEGWRGALRRLTETEQAGSPGGAATKAVRAVLALLIDHLTPRRLGHAKVVADLALTPFGAALASLAGVAGAAG